MRSILASAIVCALFSASPLKAAQREFLFRDLLQPIRSIFRRNLGTRKISKEPLQLASPEGDLIQRCNSCHDGSGKTPTLGKIFNVSEEPHFIYNLGEWEKLLIENDERAFRWLDRLYVTMVEKKSMPPLASVERQGFEESPEGKSFVEFLKKWKRAEKVATSFHLTAFGTLPSTKPPSSAAKYTPQLLSPEGLAVYKALLPRLSNQEHATILKSAGTFWFDFESMPPAYQDTKGNAPGLEGAVGVTDTVDRGFFVEGRKGSIEKGKFVFPLGDGFGLHEATGIGKFFAIRTPDDNDGKPLPIVRKRVQLKAFETVTDLFLYPDGTVFFEFIYSNNAEGKSVVQEYRTLTLNNGKLIGDVYRPFPTADHLSESVKQLYPEWETDSELAALVAFTEQPTTGDFEPIFSAEFKKTVLPKYQAMFPTQGRVDVLPATRSDVVTRLLKETPFVSAMGSQWKPGSFAPTSDKGFSLVPNGYRAHATPLQTDSCMKCHEQAGTRLFDFYTSRGTLDNEPYGRVWGSFAVGNFTFHPYDPAGFPLFAGSELGGYPRALAFDKTGRASYNGNDNRVLRKEFLDSAYVQEFDWKKHPAALYFDPFPKHPSYRK